MVSNPRAQCFVVVILQQQGEGNKLTLIVEQQCAVATSGTSVVRIGRSPTSPLPTPLTVVVVSSERRGPALVCV